MMLYSFKIGLASQVVGICALMLQANPKRIQRKVRKFSKLLMKLPLKKPSKKSEEIRYVYYTTL